MKHIGIFCVAAMLMSGLAACTNDLNYEPGGTTEVKQLLTPAEGYYVELQTSASSTLRFAWSPAFAEDGLLPHYEVLFFAKPDGEPIYRYDCGMETSTQIKHKELNKVASQAGIPASEVGALYWSVVSSRGGETSAVAAKPQRISLKRLDGFEVIPGNLYIDGDGTEANGKPIQCLGYGEDGGEFMVYARLEAGKSYFFRDGLGDDARMFSVNADSQLQENKETSTATVTGVYRLTMDFNTRDFTVTSIDRVQFYQCSQGKTANLSYAGRGVWEANNIETEGGDDRYAFYVWTNGSSNKSEKWGSSNWDNPSAPTSATSAEFWKISLITEQMDNAWGNSYKWIHSSWDEQKKVDIKVVMNLDNEARPYYYHTVSYK